MSSEFVVCLFLLGEGGGGGENSSSDVSTRLERSRPSRFRHLDGVEKGLGALHVTERPATQEALPPKLRC